MTSPSMPMPMPMPDPATAPASRVGTAAWGLPKESRERFPEGGSNLERYARALDCAEINTSFYRPHKPAVYEKWAGQTPEGFKFSAKLPRAITHHARLKNCEAALDEFLGQVAGLGPKLGCLLVQLPPSLRFEEAVGGAFLRQLRARHEGALALEPRHETWFASEVDAALRELRVARVLADPVLFDSARAPGGWEGFAYVRLHGSPRVYFDSYGSEVLEALARRVEIERGRGTEVWTIFDNTASGAATANALDFKALLGSRAQRGELAAP